MAAPSLFAGNEGALFVIRSGTRFTAIKHFRFSGPSFLSCFQDDRWHYDLGLRKCRYYSYTDVAIGAPMEGEDGSGAVYIYHGSSKGIELPYSQVITTRGYQIKNMTPRDVHVFHPIKG